jgi:hypothetical protein
VRNWEKPSWQREFGATPADLEQLADAAREVLVPGAALTRKELTAELVARTGSGHLAEVLGSGWGTVLKPLAWWGVLCHGPARGTEVTFTGPPWDAMPSPEDAARTVLGAFLGAHGPATPEMFDAWLMRGMSRKREVKGWFEAMGRELVTVEVEGVEAYALAAHVDELAVAGGSGGVGGSEGVGGSGAVRMLGGFDPYILGAGTAASYLIPPQHRGDVSRRGRLDRSGGAARRTRRWGVGARRRPPGPVTVGGRAPGAAGCGGGSSRRAVLRDNWPIELSPPTGNHPHSRPM